MDAEWQLLHDVGVPLASRHPHTRSRRVQAHADVSRAVRVVMNETEDWVPICAWVRALAHHWPSQLDAIFGPSAPDVVRELTEKIDDRGRYLKLRRIATENLASVAWPGNV